MLLVESSCCGESASLGFLWTFQWQTFSEVWAGAQGGFAERDRDIWTYILHTIHMRMRPFDSAANHYGSFVRILALYRLASTGSKFAGLLWIFVGDNPKKKTVHGLFVALLPGQSCKVVSQIILSLCLRNQFNVPCWDAVQGRPCTSKLWAKKSTKTMQLCRQSVEK